MIRTLAIAILPVLFLTVYIFRKDRLEKEPANLLFKLMLLGALLSFVPALLEGLGDRFLGRFFRTKNGVYYILEAFFVVGLSEEGFKRFILKKKTWNNRNFNCSFDAIVYASYVSLGFALLENILYVFGYSLSRSFAVGLLRAITAIPAHFFNAVFMGLYYGRAKECQIRCDTEGMRKNLRLSLWVPVALHGTYDALAFLSSYMKSSVCGYLFYGFLLLMYIISFKTVRRESSADRYLVGEFDYSQDSDGTGFPQ